MAINKAIIFGNLGRDPEIRYMPSGSAVTNITVATTEKWKDKETGEMKEQTEWHRVSFFGRQAEIIGQHFHKGDKIYVEGKIQTRKWQDKETGQDRYQTEIVGREFDFGGRSEGGRSNGGAKRADGYPGEWAPERPVNDDGLYDDDIPF